MFNWYKFNLLVALTSCGFFIFSSFFFKYLLGTKLSFIFVFGLLYTVICLLLRDL